MPTRVSTASGRSARVLAVILLLLATLAFGIGIAIEKSEEGEQSEATGVASPAEAGESPGVPSEGAEPAATGEGEEETILGIEAESTPLIVLGLVASLVAAAGLWWFGERRWVLGLVALFCFGFAVLDGIEVSRKWGDETTIAVLALAALVLHAAAGAVSAASARRLRRGDAAAAS